MKNEKPEQWSLLNIIPVPKSGNLCDTNNYRGISHSSLIAKLYNRLLLNGIRPVLGPLLRFNQNEFRVNRTTVSQILALRQLIDGIQQNNITAAMTFIDFKKAFATFHSARMIKILNSLWDSTEDCPGCQCHLLQQASKYCESRRGHRTVHATSLSFTGRHTSTIPHHNRT